MSVMRNTFSGVLGAAPNLSTSYETHTITGLTSETSSTNVTHNPEASLHFLNALHKTLIDAGYGDAVKNETDYSITILGVKIFVMVIGTSNLFPCIYTNGTNNQFTTSTTGTSAASYKINSNEDMEYNITVRGDSNHVSIYHGSYSNPTGDYPLFSIGKGKNLVTSSDIYMFGKSVGGSGIYMREADDLYNCFVNGSANPLDKFMTVKGLNTNSKFVCVPQLAYYNTCLIHSMVQGNDVIFTAGKYYKIGNEIYYDESDYLYKVG